MTRKSGMWIAAVLLIASVSGAQTAPPRKPAEYPVDRPHGRSGATHTAPGSEPKTPATKTESALSAGRYEVARYLNIQSDSAPSYSPVTDEVAFLSNLTGVNQVYKVSLGASQPASAGPSRLLMPQQLTSYEDRVQTVRWSPRGDVILFTKDRGGNERSQLFLMDTQGGNIQPLTTKANAIHSFGDFSRDGKLITYASNERTERTFDVYVMDVATRKATCVFTSPDERNYYAISFSPDARYVLASRENTNSDNDLFLVEVASGKATHLTPHQGEASYAHAQWAPDGSGFYLGTNQDRDLSGLAIYDVKTKALKYLEKEPSDLDDSVGISIDLAGTRLAYAYNHNGVSVLKLRDLKTGKVSELGRLGGKQGVMGHASFSGDGNRLALSFTSPTQPSEVWSVDTRSMQPFQLSHSSLAGIAPETFVEPAEVQYKSFDGTTIPAFLYLPQRVQKDGKAAAIVSVHGGPEGQERVTFNPIYQYFLNRGYAILALNIRGSSGFGKKYLHMDDYKKRMDAIKDVALATDYLKSTGYIDAKKIVVMGGSYGGFMTLAQVTMNPDLWAAGVDIVGIANWTTFFKNTGAWRRAYRASEYGDPEKDPEFMASISPINYADKIKAPLFVIAGANDPRVPKNEADQIVEKVKARGVPVEYISFADEGHGMAKRVNRIKGYTAIADFLDKYVNPQEATTVGK